MSITNTLRPLAGALAVAGTLAATPAAAAETLALTLISGYPPVATWTGAAVEAFVPKVDEILARTGNYEIDWNLAVSGQVVKVRGELEGVETGLGDVGIIVTAAHPDKAPLYAVSFNTPFTTKDMTLLSDTMKKLTETYPAYDEAWAALNQVSLQPASAVDNMMIWTGRKLSRLADLKGRKIGAIGPNLPWVEAGGAVGVNSDLSLMYNALATRVFEGVIIWRAAAGQFKLCEPAPYALDADIGAVSGFALNVNKDRWEALPEEVRKAFEEAAPVWKEDNIARVEKATVAMVDRCARDFGTEFTRLSDEERVRWANALPNLAQDWARRRDEAGEPGSEILTTYMDTMRAAGQPIARHWDRE